MIDRVAAERYAAALLEAAKGRGRLDAMAEAFPEVGGLILGDPELRRFLLHPVVKRDDKKRVVEKLFKGKTEDLLLDFLQLTIDKNRISLLEPILESFQLLLDEERGRQKALVETAFPLNDGQRARLAEKLGAVTGKTAVIEEKVVPGLIGGLRVRMGDKVIDGSVRNELERLKEAMLEARLN